MTETRTLTERLNAFGPYEPETGRRVGRYGIYLSMDETEKFCVFSKDNRLIGAFEKPLPALERAEEIIARRDAFTGGVA